jgi:hypothetical protein
MAPKNLECVYCGKGGFKSKPALNSHIKAIHPTQQKAPENQSVIELTIPKDLPAGPHQVQIWVDEEGNVVQSSEMPKQEIPSSSGGGDRAIPKRGAHPIVIENRYAMRRREDGTWKKTVAMMGTHGKTAPEMPWFEPGIDERWLLNDSHGIEYVKPHVEAGRVDRWWQLHHRWRVTRRATRHATDHWEWLQKIKTVPRIIMQREFAEVPNSEGFKMREISEKYIGGLLGRGAGYVQYYFTNTFSYMFAQVLYEKDMGINDWERIELYGCELEQLETEYFRQRPGIEFWFGLCVRAGIEIYVPESCFMAYAQDILPDPRTGGQTQRMVQYPGYMAYGYKSPSKEELLLRNMAAREQNLPQEAMGVDPVEENVIGAWDDSPWIDHMYAFRNKFADLARATDMADMAEENDTLNEWLDTYE